MSTGIAIVNRYRPVVPGFAGDATQRAKFAQKVHKPPLGVNVINFELNGFNVFLWVPWSLSESKVFKFTKYVERNKMHFCP